MCMHAGPVGTAGQFMNSGTTSTGINPAQYGHEKPALKVLHAERFIPELSTIARNQKNVYLLEELLDDQFVVSCSFNGISCLESQ